jgi:beta-1,2-mannobiose phosphorylase / 1,2-beta-oligomannan phosphorylase
MSITQRHTPFELHRLGVVMEPDPTLPAEAWGVLNPASARLNGQLYLFPREVAEGNYSRIGIARVVFDETGNPTGVERMGYALEPEEPYERHERAHGGVEDPRITYVQPLKCWIMAYVALSGLGPRIALAVSHDLFRWERLGLLQYEQTSSSDFNQYGNKDGMLFPDVVTDPQGRPALAILHRPTYLVFRPEGTVSLEVPSGILDDRESMWIGYISLEEASQDLRRVTHIYANELLAGPEQPWEALKIGGGTPPIRIPQGWLTYYHGVSGSYSLDPAVPKQVCYAAGALVLDAVCPAKILYRSAVPVLEPAHQGEQEGIVANVVFPTAVDYRGTGQIDIYYGMADSRIGAARSTVPEYLGEGTS